MAEKKDYTKVLSRAKRKRNNNDYLRYLIIALIAAAVIAAILLIGSAVRKGLSKEQGEEVLQSVEDSTGETTIDEAASRLAEEQQEEEDENGEVSVELRREAGGAGCLLQSGYCAGVRLSERPQEPGLERRYHRKDAGEQRLRDPGSGGRLVSDPFRPGRRVYLQPVCHNR